MVVIETARLRLRPVVAEDAPLLASLLYGDAEVTRYLPASPLSAGEQAERFARYFCDHWTQHGYGEWIIEDRRTGDPLGQCGLNHIATSGETEIDYALARRAWGRGLATEAARAAVTHADDTVNLPELVGFVLPGNAASTRILERLGFVPQGEREQWGVALHWFRRQRPSGLVEY